jgi:LysR family nitrogen assimilation transcriptional regulator
LPYSAAHAEIAAGTIKPHYLATDPARELVLCASVSLPPTPAVSKVTEICKEEIRRLIQQGHWRDCKMLY